MTSNHSLDSCLLLLECVRSGLRLKHAVMSNSANLKRTTVLAGASPNVTQEVEMSLFHTREQSEIYALSKVISNTSFWFFKTKDFKGDD